MKSPLGWARANLIYDKYVGLPVYGTLVEAMFLMVWRQRMSISLAQVRATAQASIGGDSAVDAFNEFRDLMNRRELEEKKDRMRERLEKIKQIKEIRFRPVLEDAKTSSISTVPREHAYSWEKGR